MSVISFTYKSILFCRLYTCPSMAGGKTARQHSQYGKVRAKVQPHPLHIPSTYPLTPPPPLIPPPHSGCPPTCHTLAPGASSSLILLAHSLPASAVGASTASLPLATVVGLKGKVASGGSRVWVTMNALRWVLGHQYHNGSFAGQTDSEQSPTFVNRHLAVLLLLLSLPSCRRLSLVAFIRFCDGAVWWRRRGGAGWWGRSTAPSNGWISWRRVTML